ncbi:unnamed protein product [Lampetra planeri]
MSRGLSDILEEWKCLEEEYQHAQETHRMYLQKLDEISKLQNSCSSAISLQRKRLKETSRLVKKHQLRNSHICCTGLSVEDAKTLDDIKEKIMTRPNAFFEMEAFLPKKNGLYLRLVLGNVNVTLLSKQSKFAYKDDYERFKLYLTVIALLFMSKSSTCVFPPRNFRFLDAILNFLLVWYYCTLTYQGEYPHHQWLQDQRLVGVPSLHLSFFVWRHADMARRQPVQDIQEPFLAYSLYQSEASFSGLQCYYQSGCLYRLRALGERHNMDLTRDFQSWMWKGLTFLLPFLFLGHFWQLYNSFSLFRMAQLPDCKEWQVLMCGLCFLILFTGNFFTTVAVVHQKFKKRKQKPKSA